MILEVSQMRVIAGTAKSIKLNSLEGIHTRPTTDRIKETLFNMIHNNIIDSTFLDLFSGSGGIGIEALSRGAKEAVFIDNNSRAIQCIKENLQRTKLYELSKVYQLDALSSINKLEKENMIFDILFIDPPYNKNIERQILSVIANSRIINQESIIIVETDIKTSFDYLDDCQMEIYKEKKYKTNKHVFIRVKDREEKCEE